MQTLSRDEVSRYIDADPSALYEVVADVTRTPELSPEIVSVEWLSGDGPVVGARFRARNKVAGRPGWWNTPEIVRAEPGREFAFVRRERFGGDIVWSYRFTPEGDGTRVTESYEVTRPVSKGLMFAIRYIYGRKDRIADVRAGMELSLERLAGLVGSSSGAASRTQN